VAHEVALETDPAIILMDLSLPAPGGIEATQRIKRDLPATGIIILASDEDEEALFQAIRAGAAAFILKNVGPDDLVTIIRRVSEGEFLINDKVFAKPAVASRVLKEFRELAVYGQEAAPIFAPLSPREVEILDNIAQGMTNKQVAYALSISEQTVKNHMSSILRKLSVNDRTQAVGLRHAPGLDPDAGGLTPSRMIEPARTPADLAAALDREVAGLERELSEIELLAGQARSESGRHEQKARTPGGQARDAHRHPGCRPRRDRGGEHPARHAHEAVSR